MINKLYQKINYSGVSFNFEWHNYLSEITLIWQDYWKMDHQYLFYFRVIEIVPRYGNSSEKCIQVG
jgi:hypothetical protein